MMIDLGPHAGYIVWSYLGVAIALGALALVLALESRRVKKRLADLEAQGIRRRSAGSTS